MKACHVILKVIPYIVAELQSCFLQALMGRRELLVIKVKRAFLELLEKWDIQVFLALQETKVT